MEMYILPSEWTYITFAAKDMTTGKIVFLPWLAEGHPLRVHVNHNFFWKEATKSYPGKLLELDIHLFRNNYKRASRALIRQERYTPFNITPEDLIAMGYEPYQQEASTKEYPCT